MLRRDVPSDLMALFKHLVLRKNLPLNYTDNAGDETPYLDDAEVVSSRMRQEPWMNGGEYHVVALDLDLPAHLVPSTTPGHSHLYINKMLTWAQYQKLLIALAEAGIIEDGYKNASIRRKATFLRLPWIRKGQEKVSAAVSTPEGIEAFLAEPEPEPDQVNDLLDVF